MPAGSKTSAASQIAFILSVLCCVAALPLASPAIAQVALRFDPAVQEIEIGDTGRLAILLDSPQDVRTLEVTVHYDAAYLASTRGEPGQGFVDSGCELYSDFDDATPGMWRAYVVILGANCWLTGPCELYKWDFDGIAEGVSSITAVDVVLYEPHQGAIEDVTLPDGTVTVVPPMGVVPASGPEVSLRAFPNPFNPRMTVEYDLPRQGRVAVAVFDPSGNLVRNLENRSMPPGRHAVVWDGRDERGLRAASGTYVIRMRTATGILDTRVTMVR
jgi:hypothetical protein